ncbi:MAG: TauD/TfdA family dioxygenase, partial [Candidatus Tectomicrobia bacterium]|nr:TauD/TfdA family dioxygenase [Candidatus Tectomicrobia bacterium]
FLTDDAREVEQFLRAHHYEYDWDAGDNLTYRYVLPAMVAHPQTGEELWFNQIPSHHASYFKAHPSFVNADHDDDRYPFHCHDGEGTPFSDDLVAHVRQVEWRCAVAVTWQQGDVLILDNLLAQHGRMSFVGARRILVTMFE